MTNQLPLGLYVHYPWCKRKCPYCDFNSHPKNESLITDKSYLNVLLQDFQKNLTYIDNRKFLSVYFGGGTPSLLAPDLMALLLKEISPYVTSDTEISMEANPGTVDKDRLKAYKDIGINRISLGVQSFNDKSLKLLGRIHDGKTALNACKAIVEAGFDNFNLDIMHGLPLQHNQEALEDLNKAIDTGCNHLSWYELTIEEDTYFGAHPPKLPNEDELSLIEESGFELLAKANFDRYEVSGYTKNKRCLHNQNYWYFGDYLGIGAGAHSKIKLKDTTYRKANLEDPKAYMQSVENNSVKFFKVDKDSLPFEFMLNRLRIFDKVKIDEFTNTTALDFSVVEDKLHKACDKGLLVIENDSFYLTKLGRWMLNDILEMFL
ncbi:MAG: radical SAM family heme chaperone HemW [Succinivibrio sp.]